MPIVRMPDGQNVRFPDGMGNEAIGAFIQNQFPDAFGAQPDKAQSTLSDIGQAAYEGMAPLASGALGLARIPTAVTAAVGRQGEWPLRKVGEGADYIDKVFKGWQDTIHEGQSDFTKEEKKKLNLDKGVGASLGKVTDSVLSNPFGDEYVNDISKSVDGLVKSWSDAPEIFGDATTSVVAIYNNIAESLPVTVASIIPTFRAAEAAAATATKVTTEKLLAANGGKLSAADTLVIEKAVETAAKKAAAKMGAGMEGASGGAMQYIDTRDQVMLKSDAELMASPEYRTAKEYFNGDAERAKSYIADKSALVAGVGAAIVDAAGGFAGDRYLGSAAVGKGARIGSVGRGVAQELPTEAFQSFGEKVFQNLGIKEYADPSQTLGEGAAEQAVAGGIAGGLTGGLIGGIAHTNKSKPIKEIAEAETTEDAIAATENALQDDQSLDELLAQVREFTGMELVKPVEFSGTVGASVGGQPISVGGSYQYTGGKNGAIPSNVPAGVDTGSVIAPDAAGSGATDILVDDGVGSTDANRLAGQVNADAEQAIPEQPRAADAVVNQAIQAQQLEQSTEIPQKVELPAAETAIISPVEPVFSTTPNGKITVYGIKRDRINEVIKSLGIKGVVVGNNNAVFPKGADIKALKTAFGVVAEKPQQTVKKKKVSTGKSGDLIMRIKQIAQSLGGGISSEYMEGAGAKDAPAHVKMAFKKGGKSPDEFAKILRDEGYPISEENEIADLQELIRQYVGGRRSFKAAAIEEEANANKDDKAFTDMVSEAESLGVDWKKYKTPDDLYMAIDAVKMAKIAEEEYLNEAESAAVDVVLGDDDIDFDALPNSTADGIAAWLGEENANRNEENAAIATDEESNQGAERGAQDTQDAPILESYDQAELDKRKAEADKKNKDDADAEAKAKADAEVGDFALEPQGIKQNQNDMFGNSPVRNEVITPDVKLETQPIERIVGDKLETNLPEVTHKTERGKEIQGVIAKTITKEQAFSIDKFTWKKGGGYFIRAKHVIRISDDAQEAKPSKFAHNKIFTEDKVEAARALLKKKLGQLGSGVDPEMLTAGMTLAGAHIESGLYKFADYSKAMVEDFGEAIRPYLRSFYEAVRHYPGLFTSAMTTAEELDGQEQVKDAKKEEKPNPEVSNNLLPEGNIPKSLKIPNPDTGEGLYNARAAMRLANQTVEKLQALRECLG